MANSLDPANMTLAEALIRYRLTGEPFPAHLTSGMTVIRGTEMPKAERLADSLQWGKPWYRAGGRGHDGNGNHMHGRAPGRINHERIGELTKRDITEGVN